MTEIQLVRYLSGADSRSLFLCASSPRMSASESPPYDTEPLPPSLNQVLDELDALMYVFRDADRRLLRLRHMILDREFPSGSSAPPAMPVLVPFWSVFSSVLMVYFSRRSTSLSEKILFSIRSPIGFCISRFWISRVFVVCWSLKIKMSCHDRILAEVKCVTTNSHKSHQEVVQLLHNNDGIGIAEQFSVDSYRKLISFTHSTGMFVYTSYSTKEKQLNYSLIWIWRRSNQFCRRRRTNGSVLGCTRRRIRTTDIMLWRKYSQF